MEVGVAGRTRKSCVSKLMGVSMHPIRGGGRASVAWLVFLLTRLLWTL